MGCIIFLFIVRLTRKRVWWLGWGQQKRKIWFVYFECVVCLISISCPRLNWIINYDTCTYIAFLKYVNRWIPIFKKQEVCEFIFDFFLFVNTDILNHTHNCWCFNLILFYKDAGLFNLKKLFPDLLSYRYMNVWISHNVSYRISLFSTITPVTFASVVRFGVEL